MVISDKTKKIIGGSIVVLFVALIYIYYPLPSFSDPAIPLVNENNETITYNIYSGGSVATATKAGSCPSGYVVQNTTSLGVECILMMSTNESINISLYLPYENAISNLNMTGYNITADWFFGSLDWNNIIGEPSFLTNENDPIFLAANTTLARNGTCPSGYFVQNTTNGGVECAIATSTDLSSYNTTLELSNIFYLASNPSNYISSESDPIFLNENNSLARIGSCASGYLVQNITTGGVECIAVSVDLSAYNTTLELGNIFVDWNYYATNISSYYLASNPNNYISSESDPIFLNENSSLARIGSCPSGYVAQNTTIGGVECIQVTATESDTLQNVTDRGNTTTQGIEAARFCTATHCIFEENGMLIYE